MIPPLGELDAWLAGREATAPALRPGCEKRVLWADGSKRTPWSVVYIHGFSASRREVSPYPEKVAEALGANFFGARLTGHGQDGPAMDRATFRNWMDDTTEALAVGRTLGERVVAISCSTGSTLLTLALVADEEPIAGAVLMSPNYGLRLKRLQAVLDAPLSGVWVPLLVRGPQGPPAANSQTGIWSSGYTVKAYVPMGKAMRAVRRADLGGIRTPALFAYSDADQIVDPGLTTAVMRRWGAPVRRLALSPGPGDDPMAHVLAGAALSPGQTEGVVAATLDWLRSL